MKQLLQSVGAGIARGFKSFTMKFPQMRSYFFTPRRYDFAGQVDPISNSAVAATVDWLARNFPEAPFVVRRLKGKLWEIDPKHALARLVEKPNPFYSGPILWMATIIDFVLNGNAFWLKIRSNAGAVVALWWVPCSMIEPKTDHEGNAYITHYEYTPNSVPIRVDPTDIVHFRWGLDPTDIRKGLSPMGSIIREIFTDDEASNFTASLLKNMGVPGVIVSPDSDDVDLSQEDADSIREDFDQRFKGDGRGSTAVMSGKTKVQIVSFSPTEMNLRELRRIPEERITARIGIPAVVVGLGAGLDHMTYSNMEEARQAAYENGIIPIQRLLSADLNLQLMPDFEDGAGAQTGFDLSQVRVLQDDTDRLAARIDLGVKGGYVKVGEARMALGLEAGPEHDYYLRGIAIVEVPADIEGTAQPPASQLALPPGQTPAQVNSREARLKASASVTRRRREAAIRAWTPKIGVELRKLGEIAASAAASLLKDQSAPELKEDPFSAVDFAALGRLLRGLQLEAVTTSSAEAADTLGTDPLADAERRRILASLGENIVGINEETRRAVSAAVARAQEDGTPAAQLASDLRNLGAFSPSRSATIARTELTMAENRSASATYEATGFVETVDILDGDGCGWTDHDDPDEAHGSTRTLQEFNDYPMAHPNCVRVPVPNVTVTRSRRSAAALPERAPVSA